MNVFDTLDIEDTYKDVLRVTNVQDAVYLDALHRASNESVELELGREQVTKLRDYLTEWLGDDRDVKGRPCGVTPSRSCDCPGDGQCPALEADVAPDAPQTILAEAESLVYGDRQGDYGHPREDFTRTAILWTGVLHHKLAEGEHITPEDIALCMVQVKVSREVNKPKRDNRVDLAGYALCLDRLETGR